MYGCQAGTTCLVQYAKQEHMPYSILQSSTSLRVLIGDPTCGCEAGTTCSIQHAKQNQVYAVGFSDEMLHSVQHGRLD
jgi:hypothetical protein